MKNNPGIPFPREAGASPEAPRQANSQPPEGCASPGVQPNEQAAAQAPTSRPKGTAQPKPAAPTATSPAPSCPELWDEILSGKFAAKTPKRPTGQRKRNAPRDPFSLPVSARRKELASRRKQKGKLTSEDYRELGLPIPVPESPWRAEAQIAVFLSTTCTCGAHYLAPNPGQRFIRFRHKKSGAIEELPREAGLINPALPHIIRRVEQTCEVCPACFEETPEADSQLPLPIPVETTAPET